MKITNLARPIGLFMVLAWAGIAPAATITETGLGGAVPTTGTIGNVTFDIVIGPGPLGPVTDVTVRLNLSHTQIGDLRITLSNVTAGVTRDLVYRVGATGGTGGGDNSNLSNVGGTYDFNDAYLGNIWTAAGNANGTNSTVPTGQYFASTIDGAAVSLFDGFGGLEAAGTWRLTIFDLVSNNSGTLTNWELELTTGDTVSDVPEPSAYLLFGLGLGVFASTRRFRRSNS